MNRLKSAAVLVAAVVCLAGLTACGTGKETTEQTAEVQFTAEPQETAQQTELPEPTAPPYVTLPDDASLEEASGILDNTLSTGNLLELYDTIARKFARELETGCWDIDLDNGVREDFPETLLLPEDLKDLVSDELPEEMLNRKYIVLYNNTEYKITVILGSYMSRLPAANRATSVEEAEAVLLLRESFTKRNDYIGAANDRHYDFYIMETGGKKVWKIAELVTNPPLSGKGVLVGEEVPRSELWFTVRDLFYSSTFDLTDESGNVLSFRPLGDFACSLSGVKPAEGVSQLDIPQQANGLEVIEIGKGCMEDNQVIESVSIPQGVTRISEKAFSQCSALTRVVLPDTLEIIGRLAFYDCKSLRDIEVPDSVMEFGENAFAACTALESFRIPASIRQKKSDPGLWSSGKLARVVVSEGVTKLDTVPDGQALACCYLPASLQFIDRIVNNDLHHTVFYAPEGSYAMNWLKENGCDCIPCEKPEDMPQTEYVTVDDLEFRIFNGEAALYTCAAKTDSFVIPEEAAGYPVTRILQYALVCNAAGKSVVIPASVRLISYYAIPTRKSLSISDLYITNPETELEALPDNVTIHAPESSAAQKFAEKNGNPFEIWNMEEVV